MPSLVPGYEYDIFISYRQKDNKGDRWVSDFVEALKTELESTFKEEISLYFDINPHDGLLETHDVDASLKEKLKCLVFIPIISRTYCDPKSFAWENEFKAFIEQATRDPFGLKIKLPSGNVSSRVLPVRIHDLDIEDIQLCESALGGVMRGIEFIYKEPGVNKPLTADDDEKKNQNKTRYKIQVNKAANSIKEIITALTHPEQKIEPEKKVIYEPVSVLNRIKKPGKITGIILVAILIIVGLFIILHPFRSQEKLEKSIAVLPFISPADTNTYFINNVRDEINNNLSTFNVLRVVSQYSADKYTGPAKYSPMEIAKELNVNYLVAGKGQKYRSTLNLTIELIDASKDRILWSHIYKQDIQKTEDFYKVQSKIAQDIVAALHTIITPAEKRLIEKTPTSNLTSLYYYQKGKEELGKYISYRTNKWNTQTEINNLKALQGAKIQFNNALEYDSTFALAYTGLARLYQRSDTALYLCDKALSYDSQISEAYIVRGNYYASKRNMDKAIEEYNKALKINPNSWEAYFQKGIAYFHEDFLEVIKNINAASKLNRGLELSDILYDLARAYRNAGFFEKSKVLSRIVLKRDDDSVRYLSHLSTIELWDGNHKDAYEYLKMGYKLDSTNNTILMQLANITVWLNQLTESLYYYRKYISKNSNEYGEYARFGYVLLKNGYPEEAENYFNDAITYCKAIEKSSLLNSNSARFAFHYLLASVYAIKGDKENAYKNLRNATQIQKFSYSVVWFIKNDPFFDGLRNEPEFKKIVNDLETKFKTEHERIKKSLDELGI